MYHRGPEVKEYYRMVQVWLAEKRHGATINQGLTPLVIGLGLDPLMVLV